MPEKPPQTIARWSRPEPGRRRHLSVRILNRLLRPLGYTLTSDHFYEPLPTLSELSIASESECRRQITFDRPAQMALLNELFAEFGHELSGPGGIERFYDPNDSELGAGDAELLYLVLRHRNPRRVIEIGCGGSTDVILSALAAGKSADCEFTSVDPFSRQGRDKQFLDKARSAGVRMDFLRKPVQGLSSEFFRALGPRDVLFVDSSHVLKVGSDVEHEFLCVYPRLNSGVWVHIHDIFIPRYYPIEWARRLSRYWNEQQHLEVMLVNSRRYSPVLGVSLLAEAVDEAVRRAGSRVSIGKAPGSSFWFSIVG